MQLTFTDTAAGCNLTGVLLNSTWNQNVPLSTAALKTLIGTLLVDPSAPYVEAPGVFVKRNDNGISIQTPTGSFDIHWSVLVTVPGLFA